MENHHTGNPARVLQLLLRQGRQSRQSLATALGLSVPTVAQCAAELCALGLAYEDGSLASPQIRQRVSRSGWTSRRST